ncbi:MAG: PAS domain-containing protein [Alphaproteobacteria bacterium]|nr:PAS domain-containing protein [Alphaproteobacteria bacterium]
MVAYTEAARRLRHWGAERGRPTWVGVLAQVAVILAAIGIGIGILYAAEIISGVRIVALVIGIVALGALVGVAAIAALWVHGGLEGRVDILSQALEASPDAQLIVAPDGRLAYANTAFIALFAPAGGAPLDRLAAAVDDLEAGIDFQRLRSQAMAGARAIAAVPLKDARGAAAGWFNVAVNPIPGRPGYSFWHIQDITARHEMERVIRDERNRLVDFLHEAPIGFYSVDGDGRFLFANPTLAGWLGATPAELTGGNLRLADFLAAPPSEGGVPSDPFGGRAGDAQRGEVVLKSRDGRIVHAWIGQSVVGEGDDLRTHSIVRDLTPEREWEAALRLSRERFQRFFANAPVGIALIDRYGRLEEANRALAELFGAANGALNGQPLIGFVHEDDRRELAAKLAGAAEGVPPGPIEIRIKGPRDKTCVVFLGRLDGVEGGDGSLMLHFIDVTEQKNLELQFAQSQKMQAVGQLAGGVAHDFNNLLTAMIGFCDLLLMRFKPGDPSFADIMQIKQNANRAANLVRQLLAFSRQQTLQPRILDITDVLVELSHLLRRLIGENIELKVVHGRDLGLAKVDQGQLEQVIINLAVNARDAMPGGGTLTIRTANHTQAGPMRRGAETMPVGSYVLIEVADTGMGIPKENLERIFEPFFSTKEIGSGTGLGLSTVYGIVKQTGGFIFVDSARGKGATFQIYLPRHQQSDLAAAARADTGEPAPVTDLTGIGTVMLVEDEDPVRIFGARALRNKGYTVLEARSGEAALELIGSTAEKIDLLITDVVMPKMDGPGLVREVRETHPEMKVIFISGYTEDSFRQRLDSDSNIHFLPKPFSLKQLASKVKEVIGGEAA